MLSKFEQGLGLDIAEFFNQLYSPLLAPLWLAMHTIGSELGYLVLLSIIYWCFSKKHGTALLVLVLCSTMLSSLAKAFFARPRPYMISADRITAFADEGGYGIPSGHTMFGMVFGGFWAKISFKNKDTGYGYLALLFIVLMGLSRMVLGVHFIQDVLLGLVLASLLLLLFWRYQQVITCWFLSLDGVKKSLILLCLFTFLQGLGYFVMADFAIRKSFIASAGALTGAFMGFYLETRYLNFIVDGSAKQKILRALLGLFMLAGFYFAIKFLFTLLATTLSLTEQSFFYSLGYQLRYLFTSLSAVLLIPWLLIKLNLLKVNLPKRANYV